MIAPQPAASVYERPVIKALPGLGDIDTCRRRLLGTRFRIEEAWPRDFHRRPKKLSARTAVEVIASLKRIPTPLPMTMGGKAETVLLAEPYDLFTAVGRVFDAVLVILAVDDFDVGYSGLLTINDSQQSPAEKALMALRNLTVGDLTTKIFAEIEMIRLAMGR